MRKKKKKVGITEKYHKGKQIRKLKKLKNNHFMYLAIVFVTF